jgi:hypothetical protein
MEGQAWAVAAAMKLHASWSQQNRTTGNINSGGRENEDSSKLAA